MGLSDHPPPHGIRKIGGSCGEGKGNYGGRIGGGEAPSGSPKKNSWLNEPEPFRDLKTRKFYEFGSGMVLN